MNVNFTEEEHAPFESAPPYQENIKDENSLREFLSYNEWPTGLQDFFINNVNRTSKRYFIYDDSGSMSNKDGEFYNGNEKIKCSRWDEQFRVFDFHARTCDSGLIETKFVFLNRGHFILGKTKYPNINNLILSYRNMNGGATPLCRTIKSIIDELSTETLYQQVQIVLCTDGQPSDSIGGNSPNSSFEKLLLKLVKDFNVKLVIRLCTDQEDVVEYWNKIDSDLELNLDIIDGYVSEVKEIELVNSIICYPQQIHQAREFGITDPLFDILDERELSSFQLFTYASFFIGTHNIEGLNPDSVEDRMIVDAKLRELPPLCCAIHKSDRLPVNFFSVRCEIKSQNIQSSRVEEKKNRCIIS